MLGHEVIFYIFST